VLRDVLGIGNKDGTYYVLDREGVNVVSGVRWDDADPSALPYWRRNLVPGGPIGGILATAAVDEAAGRIHVTTAPGTDVFAPQRPAVHALDLHTGAILWQDTNPSSDASFAPVSAVPGVMFTGTVIGGFVRTYDALTGTRLGTVFLTLTMASAPAVVDGTVLIGGGSGQQGPDPHDDADIASRTPSDLTALCVPGSLACDGDQDGSDFPDDCDDRNPAHRPGAREVANNGIDEDCDGLDADVKDPCLEAGSAGQDARDLAALRTVIDANCPCAIFDGTKGRGRAAYRRCAGQFIGVALAGGKLRKRCRALLVEATCGRPGSGVCCQVRLGDRRSCRVAPATRCRTTASAARTLCFGFTHCMDTACVPLGLCALP
jgi:hypothetical protein